MRNNFNKHEYENVWLMILSNENNIPHFIISFFPIFVLEIGREQENDNETRILEFTCLFPNNFVGRKNRDLKQNSLRTDKCTRELFGTEILSNF